jgi:hypothetical protein
MQRRGNRRALHTSEHYSQSCAHNGTSYCDNVQNACHLSCASAVPRWRGDGPLLSANVNDWKEGRHALKYAREAQSSTCPGRVCTQLPIGSPEGNIFHSLLCSFVTTSCVWMMKLRATSGPDRSLCARAHGMLAYVLSTTTQRGNSTRALRHPELQCNPFRATLGAKACEAR